MKEETLAKKITEQASKFKLRAAKSPEDNKRHDLVMSDERRALCTAYRKLRWSYAKIASAFDRDPRTVMRCLQKEQRILTKRKEYQQKIEQHFGELSLTALRLASNLGQLNRLLFADKIGDMVYGGVVFEIGSEQSLYMQRVDKTIALNLLSHLKGGLSELANISDWAELPSRGNDDLILKLTIQANQKNFSGKCPDCPR